MSTGDVVNVDAGCYIWTTPSSAMNIPRENRGFRLYSIPLVASMIAGIVVDTSCSEPSHCPRGGEACPCFEGDCIEGLVCLSDYCVDPDWVPPSTEEESDDDNADDDDDDDDDDGGPVSNAAACEALLEDLTCGDFDFGQLIDCSIYTDDTCSLADYFECLGDALACTDGAPDTAKIAECADLAACQ